MKTFKYCQKSLLLTFLFVQRFISGATIPFLRDIVKICVLWLDFTRLYVVVVVVYTTKFKSTYLNCFWVWKVIRLFGSWNSYTKNQFYFTKWKLLLQYRHPFITTKDCEPQQYSYRHFKFLNRKHSTELSAKNTESYFIYSEYQIRISEYLA